MESAEIAVIGGGSWGTALALHLGRSGRQVRLWIHDASLAREVSATRRNAKYLAGHTLPDEVRIVEDLGESVAGAGYLLLAVPSHHCREVFGRLASHVTGEMSFCVASKGIENSTLMRVSEILRDVAGPAAAQRTAVLSGPSFAAEVAEGRPTAVVVASQSADLASDYQQLLSAGNFRAYTNQDPVGVELSGALKNIIAIGAGTVQGLEAGSNTLAALITRGLAEMGRFVEALGGRRETLAGLAGLGDLVLTCTGSLSRNRAVGIALAQGKTLAQHQAGSAMVAEGVRTTRSVRDLAKREGIEMPITEQVYAVLFEDKSPEAAIHELMARQLTHEGC